MDICPGGLYRQNGGVHLFRVLAVVTTTTTGVPSVVHQNISTQVQYVRPLALFTEFFTYVGQDRFAPPPAKSIPEALAATNS